MFLIRNLHRHRETTALVIDLFQNPGQLFRLAFAKHRILHGQLQRILLRKSDIRLLEQIVLHRRILPQLQQDAVPVNLRQLLRVILGGQMKTLIELDHHRHIWKKLLLDFSFRPEYVLLLDQPVRRNIDAQKIFPLRSRNLLHRNLLIQIPQSRIQF